MNTKFLINYADKKFKNSQRLNSKTGMRTAGFDRIISYHPKDIDPVFKKKNTAILNSATGNGYWLWKPYIIVQSLRQLQWYDYLFYSDSGAYFIDSIAPLTTLLNEGGQDIISFELPYLERHYTKRDAFLLLGCDGNEFADTRQRSASFIFMRKTGFVIDFFNEILMYAQDERIITDMKNPMGKPDYHGFIAHRHDQSIYSLMSKKYGLEGHRMPCQLGNNFMFEYPNSKYGQLIIHTRKKSYPLSTRILQRLKSAVAGGFFFWGKGNNPGKKHGNR